MRKSESHRAAELLLPPMLLSGCACGLQTLALCVCECERLRARAERVTRRRETTHTHTDTALLCYFKYGIMGVRVVNKGITHNDADDAAFRQAGSAIFVLLAT